MSYYLTHYINNLEFYNKDYMITDEFADKLMCKHLTRLFKKNSTDYNTDIKICKYLTSSDFIKQINLIDVFIGLEKQITKNPIIKCNVKRGNYNNYITNKFNVEYIYICDVYIDIDELIKLVHKYIKIRCDKEYENLIQEWNIVFYIIYMMYVMDIECISPKNNILKKKYYTFIKDYFTEPYELYDNNKTFRCEYKNINLELFNYIESLKNKHKCCIIL